MIKSIKEKMNEVTINKTVETLAAVERERERERESLYLPWNSFTRLLKIILENKKTNNKVEIKNNSIKFNKGRTMPIFNMGIDLSFGAFWRKLRNLKNDKYLITYKKVRAGP